MEKKNKCFKIEKQNTFIESKIDKCPPRHMKLIKLRAMLLKLD